MISPRQVVVVFGQGVSPIDLAALRESPATPQIVLQRDPAESYVSDGGHAAAVKLQADLGQRGVTPADHLLAVSDGPSGSLALAVFKQLPGVSKYRFGKLEVLAGPLDPPDPGAAATPAARVAVAAPPPGPTGPISRKLAGFGAAAYQVAEKVGLSMAHWATALAPQISLNHMLGTEFVTPTLGTLARLGVMDSLPGTSVEIAARLGLDAEGTERLLRAGVATGVAKQKGDTYSVTRMGKYLQSDNPQSLGPLARMITDPAHHASWGQLSYSVQTGRPAVERSLGFTNVFDYYRTQPQEAETFNEGMTAISRSVTGSIGKHYDFSPFKHIIDVGGGHGSLLSSVLAAAPQARGTLYDQPQVVDGAGPQLEGAGVADRVTRVGGSFVDSVPPGGDLYLMKNILHDWNDEQSVHILSNIRKAMPPGARLLLVEAVVGEKASASDLMNLHMLVMNGGRERTIPQFEKILGDSGFQLTQTIPTVGPFHILEVKPTD